jgi:NAD+ diphosphatase
MISLHPSSEFKPENQNSSNLAKVYLVLRDGEILVSNGTNIVVLTEDEYTWSGMESLQELFIGYIENKACYVVELTSTSPCAENTQLSPLRSLLGAVPDNVFTICSRSLQLIDWFKHHQFCGRCGNKMKMHESERAMSCSCNADLNYPKISPCVIVLVTKEDNLLWPIIRIFQVNFIAPWLDLLNPEKQLKTLYTERYKKK